MGKREAAADLFKYISMIVVSAAIYFLLVPTYGNEVLHTNFVEMHAPSRNSANLLESFIVVLKSFGLLYFTLFILGCVYALATKSTRKIALFALSQTIVIFILFAKTQDFDTHHRYLLLPQLIMFAAIFLNRFLLNPNKYKVVLVGCLAVLLLFNWFIAFSPREIVEVKSYPTVFTNIRHPPRIRNDLKEIGRMCAVLEKLLQKTDDRIYVLASSEVLNSHIMTSAWIYFQKYKDISSKVLQTHDLDIKSGFPMPLLRANYVIVADPIQYGPRPENQRVVAIPSEMFLKQKGIATSFEKLPYEFTLKNNVRVNIYRKIKPIRTFDVIYLSELLRRYYPDREYIYMPREL